jgi:hypothetical protein
MTGPTPPAEASKYFAEGLQEQDLMGLTELDSACSMIVPPD